MESNKTKKRKVIVPNFHKYPELALQLIDDEEIFQKIAKRL